MVAFAEFLLTPLTVTLPIWCVGAESIVSGYRDSSRTDQSGIITLPSFTPLNEVERNRFDRIKPVKSRQLQSGADHGV